MKFFPCLAQLSQRKNVITRIKRKYRSLKYTLICPKICIEFVHICNYHFSLYNSIASAHREHKRESCDINRDKQWKLLFSFMSLCMSQFQTLPSPPPRERTQAFDFFKNYIANSLLQGKNWWANSSPPGYVKRWQIPHAREHMSLIEFNKPVYTNQSLLKYIKKYIKLPSKTSTSFVRLFCTNQTFTNSSFSPLTHNSVYIECKVANGNHKDTFTLIILCQIPRGFRVLV